MARYVTPIDAATRRARTALRKVARDAVVSVSSAYAVDPVAGRSSIVTTVYIRPEVATPDEVAAVLAPLGVASPAACSVRLACPARVA